jgi:hypothetical protein
MTSLLNFIKVHKLVHCIIYREYLAAKYFKYEHVEVVLKIVNYIRSSARTHRQFKTFIEEIDNDEFPDDVSWFYLVRWLSVSNVLTKFFQLMEPIKQFVKEKGKSFSQLEGTQWLLDIRLDFYRCCTAFTVIKCVSARTRKTYFLSRTDRIQLPQQSETLPERPDV